MGLAAEAMMSNETETDESYVFPQGLAGFPHATRFGFIYEGKGDMCCMQSIDSPDAAFVLTPWDQERLGTPPKLNAEQKKCLGVDGGSDVLWMLVLNPFADKQWVTANLKAPIALCEETRKGFQMIRPEPEYELRFRWMPQPKGE